MKKKGRRTLLMLLLTSILVAGNVVMVAGTEKEECCFCDGDELTTKEKCEELLVKALIDENNMLEEGVITKREYELQSQAFEQALDDLEPLTEEKEIMQRYQSILLYSFDELEEKKANGEEIDHEFYQYIMDEIKEVGLKEELGL